MMYRNGHTFGYFFERLNWIIGHYMDKLWFNIICIVVLQLDTSTLSIQACIWKLLGILKN